ncbi:MarR family winged helix-turn-helix transcriptional regulator [Paenibacillus lemnae]|uniref:Winged helix-turn-helix transcriptional regulator n=1 Tax=Paenibacillus lemnae TaxID=1330551 RepID=A0A848M0J6_PAELE|nr:MarR family winged helix-turn-helix transcriptional regulator [Paenibacillus lemnae]NMO94347.1 winged helix-turn-helix transcriptional regulator [Paenibacillus lemnae]
MKENSRYVAVREVFQQFVRIFGQLQRGGAQDCGISVIQSHILYELGKRPNISLNDLAALLHTDTSSLSRQVQQLVEYGQVNRLPDPKDRRYVVLSLTAEGEQKQQYIAEFMETFLSEVFSKIPEDQHEQVFQTLEVMKTALNSTSSPCRKEPPSS